MICEIKKKGIFMKDINVSIKQRTEKIINYVLQEKEELCCCKLK